MPKIRDFPPAFPPGVSTEFVPIDERVHPFINERRKELAPAGSAFGYMELERAMANKNAARAARAKANGQLGYVDARATNLAECAFAGIESVTSVTASAIPAGARLIGWDIGSEHVHTGATAALSSAPATTKVPEAAFAFPPDAPGGAYLVKDANGATCWRTCVVDGVVSYTPLLCGGGGGAQSDEAPASDASAHVRTGGAAAESAKGLTRVERCEAFIRSLCDDSKLDWSAGCTPIRLSDVAGVAAQTVAAEEVLEATPDPVVSVLGQQVAESELAEALQLIRQKNAPPAEKETPRGLLCVRDFDHRLGAWGL